MDIRIGAAVQCTDGPGGHITSIILNPITQHVTDVVVHEPGFLGSDVIVPVTQIEQATADTLQMRLSRHDLAGRQSFLTTQYLPPSDDFLRTAPWSAYPYGGIYSSPYLEMQAEQRMMTYEAIPLDELAMRRGDHVEATDGRVGRIDGFVAIFYGIAVIWERDMGILQKFLASPVPRSALVLGKALSAGVRALVQAAIVYALALALGVQLNGNPLALLDVLATVLLGAALFATFSLIIACLVKTRERFMGIGQVLTMPLFFASNAIYPIAIMPTWLQVISHLNPLSYEVDALRALMLAGGTSSFGLGLDFIVLLVATTSMVLIGARLYPQVVT